MLPDNEQGIWLRGGAILPILQHTDEMSLLHALGNDISLEVYPAQDGTAGGQLYMDDGQTFAHEKECEKVYVFFGFEDNMLYTQRDINDDCRYVDAEKQKISKVTIYDVIQRPEYIELTQRGGIVDFVYDSDEMSVTIDLLEFTVDTPESKQNVRRDLLEIHYRSSSSEPFITE